MGLDLTAGFIHHIESSPNSWPKCDRCSKRLGRPYPVETFGMVGRERPRQRRDKQRIIAEVECHGERQEFALDCPIWAAEANIHDMFGQTICFIQLGGGRYGTGLLTQEQVRQCR
jgi:hypothetical protein